MSKTTVIDLAFDFTGRIGNTTQIGLFYDRAVEDLARFPWLTTGSITANLANSGVVALGTTQAKLIAVFYDNRQLMHLTNTQLDSINRNWRDERGDPIAYTTENEVEKALRLYPIPTLSNKPLSYPNSQPFGIDFPAYAVTLIHTELRTDIPAWLEPAVALECAAREMERESNHRDVVWAQVARSFADTLFSMVGKS